MRYIVGTPGIAVTLRLAIAFSAASGSNLGSSTISSPTSTLRLRTQVLAKTWNSGSAARMRSALPPCGSIAATCCALILRLAWVRTAPFGVPSPAPWYALIAQRYLSSYTIPEEDLGWVAVHARKMAALNPNAIYQSPLSIDDYLASRYIATPLRLYDCDVPVDGATAFVLSRIEDRPDRSKPLIRFEAIGAAMARGGLRMPEDWTSFGAEIPADWKSAIDAAKRSTFLQDALGADMHRTFTAIMAAEYARVMRTVSEVDFDLYLHTV